MFKSRTVKTVASVTVGVLVGVALAMLVTKGLSEQTADAPEALPTDDAVVGE